MKYTIIFLVIFSLMGCATKPLTEDQIYDKENKATLRLEKYYRDLAVCEAQGGIMHIDRQMSVSKLRRNAPPKWGERYGCMSSQDFQRMMRQMGY